MDQRKNTKLKLFNLTEVLLNGFSVKMSISEFCIRYHMHSGLEVTTLTITA